MSDHSGIPYHPRQGVRRPNTATTRHLGRPGLLGDVQFALACVLSAMGVLLVGVADKIGRTSPDHKLTTRLFWLGIVTILLPLTVFAIGKRRDSATRLAALLVLGGALFLVKVMLDPIRFSGVDELQQLRGVIDVSRTNHLFTTNPLVSGYSDYPGLQILTSALQQLTGCSTFVAGSVLLGVCRLVMVVSLYLVLSKALDSAWGAGVGTLIYICNPNFLFFDSEFGYESLALALAFSVPALTIYIPRRKTWRPAPIEILVVVVSFSVVITHHLTSVWLSGILLLWALGEEMVRPRLRRRPAWFAAVLTAGATTVWIAIVARQKLGEELDPVATNIQHAVGAVLSGGQSTKVPFGAGGVPIADPAYAHYVGFAAVALLLLSLPLALPGLRRRCRRVPLLFAVAVPAVLYPFTLALRLTSAGSETSNRASEFLYLPLSATVFYAVLILRNGRRWHLSSRCGSIAGLGSLVLLFVGGIVIGTAPYDRTPGPYLPSAGIRSITVRGVDAATWAGGHLPRNSSVVADIANRLLMGSYGGLHPQLGEAAGLPVANLLLNPNFGVQTRRIVAYDKISYVVADSRLAESLPGNGQYVGGGEPMAGHYARPVPLSALTKFSKQADVGCIFDDGKIKIYDTSLIWQQRQ